MLRYSSPSLDSGAKSWLLLMDFLVARAIYIILGLWEEALVPFFLQIFLVVKSIHTIQGQLAQVLTPDT